MTVAMHPRMSAAQRLAIIDEQLDALTQTPAHELSEGDHLAVSHRLLTMRRRMDALASRTLDAMACSGQWADDAGARSAASWLTGSTTETRSHVTTAMANGAFQRQRAAVETAALAGDISSEHVRVWRTTRHTYARIAALLDAVEDHILQWAKEMEPRSFRAALIDLAHRLDPDLVDDIEAKKQRRTYLDVVTTLDGYVHVSGLLDPATGSYLQQCLDSARRAATADEADDPESGEQLEPDAQPHEDPAQARRNVGQRNVEALRRILDMCSSDLSTVAGYAPRITVRLDADTLLTEAGEPGPSMAWLEKFGLPVATITASTARALACDAVLQPIVIDRKGNLATVLPTVRTVSSALRAAVINRDHHCRFTNCTARIDEVHHIRYYSSGGPTTIDNLIGLCYFHHHLIHRSDWQITGDPGGDIRFHRSRSRRRPTLHRESDTSSEPDRPPGLLQHRKRQRTHEIIRLLDRERNQSPDPPF